MSNGLAKPVLLQIPQCDHAPSVRRIDIGLQPLPDSSALGLTWDPESDTLRVSSREFVEATTRREMTSQLASQFDPLGIVSPLLLSGKLVLQKAAASGVDWDEKLPEDVRKQWNKWRTVLNALEDYHVPRNCLLERIDTSINTLYQLHGFCDASDNAFSCVNA